MTGLDENCLRNLKSSEILKQGFLRCDSKENISEKQSLIQKTFLKASIDNEPIYVNQPIYETIDELIMQALYSEPVDNEESVYSEPAGEPIYETIPIQIQALYSEPVDNKESVYSEPVGEPIYQTIDEITPIQKTESVIPNKSLLKIEGNFKKRDAKNIQRIKDTTEILTIYDPGQVNFDVQFNLILNAFKNLKSSSSKLAAFIYILDSTKDKESSKTQINNNKIYKELPRKYKKLIKRSNPKFSLDMQSTESLKSIDSIRAHLKKRSIFIKEEPLPLKDRI